MIVKIRNNPQYSQNVECLVPSGAQKTNKEIGHREGRETRKNSQGGLGREPNLCK